MLSDTATLRRRTGFTLIELLVVVVVVGVLAAVAIPRFQNTKGRANFAALKSDLRNVVAAQEAFFYVNRRYAVDLDSLSLASSKGVVLSVREVVADGFSASAYHRDSWPRTCAIFVGSATPLPPATANGIVACE